MWGVNSRQTIPPNNRKKNNLSTVYKYSTVSVLLRCLERFPQTMQEKIIATQYASNSLSFVAVFGGPHQL